MKAAKADTPPLSHGAPAVVLFDETLVTIESDGDKTIRHRQVVRILNQSGRQFATGMVPYLEKEDDVTTTEAWVVRAGKEVSPKEKPMWIDMSAADDGAVFSEVRKRVVSYNDFALTDDVFAYETVSEGKLDLPQLGFSWVSMLPVIQETLTLQLPPGWAMQSMVDGPSASLLHTATGPQSWTWELIDRPYRPDEPSATEDARTDVRLMVTLSPPAKAPRGMWPVFRSWSDLSSWMVVLQDAQCDSTPALLNTTNQLATGNEDVVVKMRALSRYVQSLRYISFDKGISKGFGYRPRKASEVYEKGWGDCKAKANLLRSMLRTVGIESYMVSAHTSQGRQIVEGWPSPAQFNHAILAIKIDDSVDFPTVVNTPILGRLLFFDATNPDVLLGDLPTNLQGGKVHVVAPGSDALTPLPVLPAETHHLSNRQVNLELNANGSVTGECNYGGPGSSGAYYRRKIRSLSANDFQKNITERINGTVSGASIENLTTSDEPITGECRIKYRFSAPRFAQMMPGGLAVVRLDVLSRDTVPAFPAKERKLPIQLDSMILRDEVTLKLPPGFVVDELPDSAKFNSPYGHYESTYSVVDGSVVAHRMLRLEDRDVPVSEYAVLRKFLGDVAKADHSSVVLRKSD
ncbi:MAG: DUF3857 domain-containing protein [Verrucomicrobia bacterium]|nr:DUF3857 domain-containing protein [Verrucomicrobiota bacterium]